MVPYTEYENISEYIGDDDIKNSFESFKKHICMRAFNRTNIPNGMTESLIPHKRYADIALTFALEKKIYVGAELGRGYFMITNDILKDWNISFDELFNTAVSNMENKNSSRIETIAKHLSRTHILHPIVNLPEQFGMKMSVESSSFGSIHSLFQIKQYGEVPVSNSLPKFMDDSDDEKSKDVLIVSNRTMSFAAVNLFIGKTMEDVYDRFLEDYYIVPISVHEIMCVKESHALRESNTVKEAEEDLSDMLEQINDKVITDEADILSYNVYKYMHDEKCAIVINN